MKRNIIILLSILVISCNKDEELVGGDLQDFVVKTNSSTFKVGQEVIFSFEGNPGLVSFYSGEVYRDYAFKEGRIVKTGQASVSFTTAVTGGTQADQLSIVASSDFDGNYADFSRVKAATWTNITNRFLVGTNATFKASGVQDITDLVKGKPIYLAYKYITKPQTANGIARTWMAQSFSLTSSTPIGTLTIADMSIAGFRIIQQIRDTTSIPRSSVSASRVTLLGNNFDKTNDPLHEIWAISKPINTGEIDLGPDRPIPIKGYSETRIQKYTHIYKKPGTYKVYFIGANKDINESKEVVRDLELTIIP